jgi:hypothetical protein
LLEIQVEGAAGSWWVFMPKLYWFLLPAGIILYLLSR